MANKVKLEIPKMETKTIEFLGKNVKINDHISMENYSIIANDIRNNVLYNDEVTDKYALLIIRTYKDILDLCTNINTEDMTADELVSDEIWNLLIDNIGNFHDVEEWLNKEYDKFILESSLGALGNKMPSSAEMEKSMDSIAKTINELPEDKLELLAKSIVWNNAPALGQQIAPAEHKTEQKSEPVIETEKLEK